MPRFELTRFVTSMQKRCFYVQAPDAATAKQRIVDGRARGVTVGEEAVLYRSQLECNEIAPEAAPGDVKARTDQDGCPVWVRAEGVRKDEKCSAKF